MNDRANPYDEMARMWARTMTGGLAAPMKGGDGEAADGREWMWRWTDAYVAMVESGFRYMSRWAELSARAYPLAVRVMRDSAPGADPGGKELGPSMDELRETLREMAELPLKEYRRLQDELADLSSTHPSEGGTAEGGTSEGETSEGETSEGEAPKRRQRRARVKD